MFRNLCIFLQHKWFTRTDQNNIHNIHLCYYFIVVASYYPAFDRSSDLQDTMPLTSSQTDNEKGSTRMNERVSMIRRIMQRNPGKHVFGHFGIGNDSNQKSNKAACFSPFGRWRRPSAKGGKWEECDARSELVLSRPENCICDERSELLSRPENGISTTLGIISENKVVTFHDSVVFSQVPEKIKKTKRKSRYRVKKDNASRDETKSKDVHRTPTYLLTNSYAAGL